jgi:hypothetical protein
MNMMDMKIQLMINWFKSLLCPTAKKKKPVSKNVKTNAPYKTKRPNLKTKKKK